MMKSIISIPVRFLILFAAHTGYAQEPVIWHFAAAPVTGNETTLLITADLASGWHLYSQRIAEGGPIPTRFRFDGGDDCIPAGITHESGAASVFYDDTYEMEITWYSGKVKFSQRLNLSRPEVTIKGKVEYMTCNNDVCVPGEQEFSVDASP